MGVLARGVVVSLGLLTLTATVLGLALGAFYAVVPLATIDPPAYKKDDYGPAWPDVPPGVLLALAVLGGAAVALYLLHLAMLALPLGAARRVARLERLARVPLLLAVPLALLGVGVPALIWVTGQVSQLLADLGGRPVSAPVTAGLGTVALAYLSTVAGVGWKHRKKIGSVLGRLRPAPKDGAARPTSGAVPTGWMPQALVWLALLVLVAALLLVLGAVTGLSRDWPLGWRIGLPSALLLAVLGLDQTWLSLHPFYRRRLATAFAVRRGPGRDGRVVATPYDFDTELTSLSPYAARVPGFPKVIFAAAANLSGSERTPPGRRAGSYTLADDWVGGPDVGWVRTAALQDRTRGQLRLDLTVQAAAAVSGAAFASAMGRQARAYQTLFALSGARLGAWLPNPAFVQRTRAGDDWRAPRLPRLRRLPYLLREITGNYPYDDRLLYCTDGGHYENLGLVELLRHRCRLIYCIDASGDSPPLATTLGEAITLAYEELGVRITLTDPRDLVPGHPPGLEPTDPLAALNARLSGSGVVVGDIVYPELVPWSASRSGRRGKLVVVKASMPADLPYELLAYAAVHPEFPRDTTGDQWFDHGQFDAYQSLGRHLGARAAVVGKGAEAELGPLSRTRRGCRRR